ncbi:MAG: malectin domain-containing carbohydrate-binding protein, partial [Candidatus Poribacteria bacterium]
TKNQKPDVYSVRLGFIATSGDKIGERLFDIKLQGKVVAKDFDILKTAGASDKSIVKEFENIKVDNNLVVELVPKATDPTMSQAPMINFIEVVRKDALK